MSIITFPENSKGVIDINQAIGRTNYLESCVAIASHHKNHAPFAHLTQLTQLTDFFKWFTQVTPRDSQCYVVGGMVNKSEEFVEDILMNLLDSKYTKIKMDVLGPHHRIFSFTQQEAKVEYFHQTMDATRQIIYQPIGNNIL